MAPAPERSGSRIRSERQHRQGAAGAAAARHLESPDHQFRTHPGVPAIRLRARATGPRRRDPRAGDRPARLRPAGLLRHLFGQRRAGHRVAGPQAAAGLLRDQRTGRAVDPRDPARVSTCRCSASGICRPRKFRSRHPAPKVSSPAIDATIRLLSAAVVVPDRPAASGPPRAGGRAVRPDDRNWTPVLP